MKTEGDLSQEAKGNLEMTDCQIFAIFNRHNHQHTHRTNESRNYMAYILYNSIENHLYAR